MEYSFAQITDIILNNPNKILISNAQKEAKVLMLHGLGIEVKESQKQLTYFENTDLYSQRKNGMISNADLFARILHKEDIVFHSTGGSFSYNGLSTQQTEDLNSKLNNISLGMSLRKWIKCKALQARRYDPMGIIFMECDSNLKKIYPTYKTILSIYDYLPNGRNLEYVCFNLSKSDCKTLQIDDKEMYNSSSQDTFYYRFVDGVNDWIVKKLVVGNKNTIIQANDFNGVSLSEPHFFSSCPAFLASDEISFENDLRFISPLHNMMELAFAYLQNRSIRDLCRIVSGYPKAVEPAVKCGTCGGDKYVDSLPCPDCTPAGSNKPSGVKINSKPADKLIFPVEAMDKGFDFHKILGWAERNVDNMNYMDAALIEDANLLYDIYWNTDKGKQTTFSKAKQQSTEETATKTNVDLQPIYGRLISTSNWAEQIENLIVKFIGEYYYDSSFKGSSIHYGHNFVLETPEELMAKMLEMKSKGANEADMTDIKIKYYQSRYQSDPEQLAIRLKLINVEPFSNHTIAEVQAMNVPKEDWFKKLYFDEWLTSKSDDYLFITQPEKMIADISVYVNPKLLLELALTTAPIIGNQSGPDNFTKI